MRLSRLAFLYLFSGTISPIAAYATQVLDGDTFYDGPSMPLTQKPEPDNTCSSSNMKSYQHGSIIDCRDQSLFQVVPLNGIPFDLVYSSRNQAGTANLGRTLKVNVEKYYANSPARFGTLLSIKASAVVAGKSYTQTYTIAPNEDLNQPFAFQVDWDGKNSSGETVSGLVESTVKLEYFFSGTGTEPITVFVDRKVTFGTTDVTDQKLGGWTISSYHRYYPLARSLLLGSGLRLKIEKKEANGSFRISAEGNTIVPSDDLSKIFHFSPSGLHVKTTDAISSALIYSFQHDTNGLLVSITDRNGKITQIERDANGQIIGIMSPFSLHYTVSTNADGLISEIKNPSNQSQKFNYLTGSFKGLMTSAIDARGNSKSYSYDASGLLQSATDAKGGVKSLATSSTQTKLDFEKTVTHTSPLGRVSTYKTRDWESEIIRTNIEPNGRTTIVDEWKATNRNKVTTPEKIEQVFIVGQDSRFPERSVVQSVENSLGLGSTEVVIPPDVAYTRTYDLASPGDPLSLTKYTEKKTVTGIGDFTTVIDNNLKSNLYTSPSGLRLEQKFDALGQIVSEQLGNLTASIITYNNLGQVTRMARGTKIYNITYNAKGLPETVQNPLGDTTAYSYDAAGQLVTRTLPNGNQFQYSYDADGRITTFINAAQAEYAFSFDENGRKTQEFEPILSGINSNWLWSHNSDNQVTIVTKPDASQITYSYDTKGNLATAVAPNASRTYTWLNGEVKTIQSTSGGSSVTVSQVTGRRPTVTSWGGAVNGSISYQWNAANRLKSFVVAGNIVNFTYNADGEVMTINGLTHTRNASTGLIEKTTFGKTVTTNSYDTSGALSDMVIVNDGTELYRLHYIRDAMGRVTTIQATSTAGGYSRTLQYTYDSIGQLISDVNDWSAAEYTYSPNGNRYLSGLGNVYDAQDRLVSDNTWNYTYNKAGYLEQRTRKVAGRKGSVSGYKYEWDDFGNLVSYKTLKDGSVVLSQANYAYDGLNRRVATKDANGNNISSFIYQDNLRPVAEYNADGSIKSVFAYGSKPNVPDLMIQGATTYQIISDHLGSPLFVIAQDGFVREHSLYHGFGEVVDGYANGSDGEIPFGFAGGLKMSGLLKFGARYYDPAFGRWISKDPIRFSGGTNLYAYVNNDPVNYVDQTGLDAEWLMVNGFHSVLRVDNPYGGGSIYIDQKPKTLSKAFGSASLLPVDGVVEMKHSPGGLVIPGFSETFKLTKEQDKALLDMAVQSAIDYEKGKVKYELLGLGGQNCHTFVIDLMERFNAGKE